VWKLGTLSEPIVRKIQLDTVQSVSFLMIFYRVQEKQSKSRRTSSHCSSQIAGDMSGLQKQRIYRYELKLFERRNLQEPPWSFDKVSREKMISKDNIVKRYRISFLSVLHI